MQEKSQPNKNKTKNIRVKEKLFHHKRIHQKTDEAVKEKEKILLKEILH